MASKYTNTNKAIHTNIQAVISIIELLIISRWTAHTIIIIGIHNITQALRKNLNLINACLSSHLIVKTMLDAAKDILFITASRAEQSFSTI